MTIPVDPSGIGKLLADSLKALGDYRSATENGAEAEPVQGTGTGADGMVTATAKVPGEVAITMDPRVMRMDSQTLAEQTSAAVNAALADLRDKAAKGAGAADLSDLDEQLKSIQDTALPQLKSFTNVLVETQERIARGGGK